MIKIEKLILHKVNNVKNINEYLFMLKQTLKLINKSGYIPQKGKTFYCFRIFENEFEYCEHKSGIAKFYRSNNLKNFKSNKSLFLKEIFKRLKDININSLHSNNMHKNKNKVFMIGCDNKFNIFEENKMYFCGLYTMNPETFMLRPFNISEEFIEQTILGSKFMSSGYINNNLRFNDYFEFIEKNDYDLYNAIKDTKNTNVSITKCKLCINNKKHDPFSKFIYNNIDNDEYPKIREKYFINYVILKLNDYFYKFIVQENKYESFFVHDKNNNILIKISEFNNTENLSLNENSNKTNNDDLYEFNNMLPKVY